MKEFQLTRSGDKESRNKLVEQLENASKTKEEFVVFEILKEEDEDIRLEAVMIPNKDEYAELINYLKMNNADKAEYDLKDSEITAQIGLNLMMVAMSMGGRNTLFVDKQDKLHFAMIAKPVFDEIKKCL
jgi:bifunctional ADP-heptose synthase (sugar kinase/adenylyltransferase)